MIRFFADIIYLFFFLTLTAPLYPLFEHWNKSGKSHKRSSIAQRMILKSFKLCLAMAGTKLVVDGEENIPDDTAVLYVGNHSSYYDILCSYWTWNGILCQERDGEDSLSGTLDAFYQLSVFRS